LEAAVRSEAARAACAVAEYDAAVTAAASSFTAALASLREAARAAYAARAAASSVHDRAADVELITGTGDGERTKVKAAALEVASDFATAAHNAWSTLDRNAKG
jgi:hypothetical protein